MSRISSLVLGGSLLALVACTGSTMGLEEEDVPSDENALPDVKNGDVESSGAVLFTTASTPLRVSASKTGALVRTLSAGARLVVREQSGTQGWYAVEIRGSVGFVEATGLKRAPKTFVGSTAHTKALANVGHAYHWGKALLPDRSPTATTKGSCSGNCPSCSMSGKYGADCSGYVGVVFELPNASAHPVTTGTLEKDNDQWVRVSREEARFGDAFAYNDGGGHVVIYETGDAWGTPMVYEARGCAYGIVHNTHKLSSAYVGVRRF